MMALTAEHNHSPAPAPEPAPPPVVQKKASSLTETMERIALCESRNDPLAKNPRSTASGRFQFLKGSWAYYGEQLWGDAWMEKDVFDYHDNTELAYYVAKTVGLSPWDASRYCWELSPGAS